MMSVPADAAARLSATARQAVSARDWPTVGRCARKLLQIDRRGAEGATAGGDGLTLLAEIQQELPDAPIVVMMTAFGTIKEAVEATKRGAVDYVTKPIEPRVLLARIRAQLRRTGAPTSATT